MGVMASIIPMVGRVKLPPYTLRFKANRAVSLSDFRALPITLTLVDDARHIYDLKLERADWSNLFDPASGDTLNTWLIEVIAANTHGVTSMSYMFRSCASLVSVSFFDTSSVTSMSSMFNFCSSLTSVPLFDTSRVTNMRGMLYRCTSLESIPLFDTSSVTDMSVIAQNCTKVKSGALALYTQASTQETPPTSYANAFTDCGSNTPTGLAELQQIPTSWGGRLGALAMGNGNDDEIILDDGDGMETDVTETEPQGGPAT